MFPADEWDNMGGPFSLLPDKVSRRITMVHMQSGQDRVLEFLTQLRHAKKKTRP